MAETKFKRVRIELHPVQGDPVVVDVDEATYRIEECDIRSSTPVLRWWDTVEMPEPVLAPSGIAQVTIRLRTVHLEQERAAKQLRDQYGHPEVL